MTTGPGRSSAASPAPSSPEGAQVPLLLAQWRQSLELHTRYAALDDEHYWHVQPWPRHERPARWIIELARERVGALSRLVDKRQAEGDRAFLEALELMASLASLVGLQSIERYIPLASIENERRDVLTTKLKALGPDAQRARSGGTDTTQRMRAPAKESGTRARTGEHKIAKASPAKRTRGPEALVIEDATRLLGWGREWHELPELISRLSERPPVSEVRRILRDARSRIDKTA